MPEFPSFSRLSRTPFCVSPPFRSSIHPSVAVGAVSANRNGEPTALRLCPVLWSLYPHVAILTIFLRLPKWQLSSKLSVTLNIFTTLFYVIHPNKIHFIINHELWWTQKIHERRPSSVVGRRPGAPSLCGCIYWQSIVLCPAGQERQRGLERRKCAWGHTASMRQPGLSSSRTRGCHESVQERG